MSETPAWAQDLEEDEHNDVPRYQPITQTMPAHSEGLVKEETSGALPTLQPRAVDMAEEEPESLQDRILALPKTWMRAYMRELFLCGSPHEARLRIKPDQMGISPYIVQKACAELPEFADLHRQATEARHERVDNAVYRGATEGDEIPLMHQGVAVDSYRKRSDKAAEVYYKRHGLLAEQQVSVNHTGRVTMAPDAALPGVLAELGKLLFPAPAKTIDAASGKVVSEPDK